MAIRFSYENDYDSKNYRFWPRSRIIMCMYLRVSHWSEDATWYMGGRRSTLREVIIIILLSHGRDYIVSHRRRLRLDSRVIIYQLSFLFLLYFPRRYVYSRKRCKKPERAYDAHAINWIEKIERY